MAGFNFPDSVTTGLDLVEQVMIWECSREQVSAGMVALADWIVDDPDRAYQVLNGAMSPVAGRMLYRVLAGHVLLGGEQGEWLALTTGGRVTAAMFRRRLTDHLATLPVAEPAPAADAIDMPRFIARGEARCTVSGTLGSVPSGPLFRATIDPAQPNGLVLSGLGLALCLSEDVASAMAQVLADGLVALRGERQPERRSDRHTETFSDQQDTRAGPTPSCARTGEAGRRGPPSAASASPDRRPDQGATA